jgi:hypothetical protein
MDIIGLIKKRKSCRTFNKIPLKPADKKELESFIAENRVGLENEIVNFQITGEQRSENQMKLNYGMIQGHKTCILGTSKSTHDSRVNYGYLLEKIVLKATEMNISTCWIGVFDSAFFHEVYIQNGFEIPAIVLIGYSKEEQTFQEKITRFSLNASKRFNPDKLFFDYREKTAILPGQVEKYSDSLEMVRLAPSSGNTQPWRVFFDDNTNEFHFYKKPVNKWYESLGLHDIDMGIALCHFEMTSLQNGLPGTWIRHQENVRKIDDLQYIISWEGK